MMGASPTSRTSQSSRLGKGIVMKGGVRDFDPRRSTRISVIASPAKSLSPAVSSASSDPEHVFPSTKPSSMNGSDDIAPEIVVWTGDMDDDMIVDSPEAATPANAGVKEKISYVLDLPLVAYQSSFLSLMTLTLCVPCSDRASPKPSSVALTNHSPPVFCSSISTVTHLC